MNIGRRGLIGTVALLPVVAHAKQRRGSIITLTFANIRYDIELKALSKFRPVTDYERQNVGGGAETKLDYLFIAYAKETVEEIMELIAWTSEAPNFGVLTQTNGDQFAFRGPDNAQGPLPVTSRDQPQANAGLMIKRRRKQVIETQQQVSDVIEACGGLAVPPVPSELEIDFE